MKILIVTCVSILILVGILIATDAGACPDQCPPKPRTIYITKTVESKATPANATASASNSATTGNQVVNVIQPQPKPIVIKLKRTVIKHRKVIKHIRINHYKNNRLMLLGGATKTKLDIDFDCCNLDIKRRYEPDFGLQYIRDFGTLSAGIIATSNRSVYLNIGVSW